VKQAENSDVSPLESVAVAVTTSPMGSASTFRENVALPSGPVATAKCARKCAPSPFPEGSHVSLA
jgi:hypothetical protein